MSPAITDVYSQASWTINLRMMFSFNDDLQLTFYGAYHNNKYNILIHVLCVPWLLWYIPPLL